MPQPGVPYRPIVAVPQKINHLNPFFAICQDIFFTALDPPRALVTAPNLVLKPTIAHLQVPTTPPMPSRILNTDSEDNGSARPTTSVPRPAHIPKAPVSQQTDAPGPGQRVRTKPDPQSGTSRYDPDSGSHSGLEAGDSSDPRDQGYASSGYAEQDPENNQEKSVAIGNHDPGEAVTVNGQVAQPLSDDAISIAGTTLTPGASPITLPGREITLGQSVIAVGSSSVPIATAADSVWIPGRVTTIDSQLIQPIAGNEVSIAGTSLVPSHAVTIAGTTVSLDASSNLHIGSSTIYLGDNAAPMSPQVFTVAGQAFTANPNAVDVAGLTLALGGNGITVSGRNVSLNSAGNIVAGSSTISIKIPMWSLGGLMMGEFDSTRASSLGLISSESGVQTFRGRAETLQVSLSAKLMGPVIFVASISTRFELVSF